MENDHLNALLKRDIDTAAGLKADQPHYQPLEDDIEPLRTEHAANLARAQLLETNVVTNENDDSAQIKGNTRRLLKPLAARLAAALQAYAASRANKDEDLASRINFGPDSLGRAVDSSFGTIVGTLLREGQPLAAELAKREFSADDLATTHQLLQRFTKKRTQHRLVLVDGGTDRKTLIALLRRNSDLIKQLRKQLKPYQNSPTKHDVWLRFQGYTKVIEQKGGGQKGSATPPGA